MSWTKKIGILGGGQLGRMFIEAASRYDVEIHILDPNPNAPCAHLAHNFVVGDFNDEDAVFQFGQAVDVVTIEIENVSVAGLKKLEAKGKDVFPQPTVIELIQDKGLQKEFYAKHQIPTLPFELVDNAKEAKRLMEQTIKPYMQKLRKGGYDGRGVQALRDLSGLEKVFDAPSVMEEFLDIEKEISVIVGRNKFGEIRTFPLVELVFDPVANLVDYLQMPAEVNHQIAVEAENIAVNLAKSLEIVGLLAVEMFVTKDGKVLVNEVAPRTHNSGHHSIEACVTSQFEQHLRTILNWPLGSTEMLQPAVMVNLLGEENETGPVAYEGIEDVLKTDQAYVHLYGKADTKPYRKMGHLTVLHKDLQTLKEQVPALKQMIKVKAVKN